MLVSKYLEQVREEMDKEGQPYFEDDDLIRRFEVSTYAFLEANIEFMQYNQKAREDLGGLTVSFDISQNTAGFFAFATTFYRLISVFAIFQSAQTVLKVVQSSDYEKLKQDPFHTPGLDAPLGQFYNNGLLVEPIPKSISGFFLKKPTFGANDNDELIGGLPIYIQYHIIKAVELGLMTTTGDERFQYQLYQSGKQ